MRDTRPANASMGIPFWVTRLRLQHHKIILMRLRPVDSQIPVALPAAAVHWMIRQRLRAGYDRLKGSSSRST